MLLFGSGFVVEEVRPKGSFSDCLIVLSLDDHQPYLLFFVLSHLVSMFESLDKIQGIKVSTGRTRGKAEPFRLWAIGARRRRDEGGLPRGFIYTTSLEPQSHDKGLKPYKSKPCAFQTYLTLPCGLVLAK